MSRGRGREVGGGEKGLGRGSEAGVGVGWGGEGGGSLDLREPGQGAQPGGKPQPQDGLRSHEGS